MPPVLMDLVCTVARVSVMKTNLSWLDFKLSYVIPQILFLLHKVEPEVNIFMFSPRNLCESH